MLAGEPGSKRRPSARNSRSSRKRSCGWRRTLRQPASAGVRRSRSSGVVTMMPAPSGPSSHLWPSATKASAPRSSKVSGSTPRPWMASTTTIAPHPCAASASAATGATQPVWNATHETASSRTGGASSSTTSSTAIRPSRDGKRRTSTPRRASASHGATLAANSSSPTSTASPGRQSSPCATCDSPSDVLRTIDTSAGATSTSWPARERIARSVSRQASQSLPPARSCSSMRARIASATRAGQRRHGGVIQIQAERPDRELGEPAGDLDRHSRRV